MEPEHLTGGKLPAGLLDRLVPFHLVLDRELRVRTVGSGLRAVLQEDLQGRPLLDVLSVVSPALTTPADLARTTGTELRCQLRDRPLALRAQLHELDEDGFLLAATPELTLAPQPPDLKEMVEQLEDREVRLSAIIDTAIDAILTIDEGCKIERINPAALRLFGYAREELVGRDFRILLPSPDDDRDIEFLEILAMSGIRGDFTAASKTGRPFAAELSVSKLVVRGRTRFTAIIRDISERKKLEQLQSEFVSTVSHELRTPLTAIRGALGLVAGGVTGPLPPGAEECVQIALSNSDRLIRILNDILDLEKIQSGQMEFRMELLDLRAVVSAALAANAAFAATNDIQLRLLPGAAAGDVLGDEQRLIQVLTNLISNAAKFSPPGGVVDVGVEQLGGAMRVSVRDRGKGIPREFHDRIFQRFAQADASSTRQKGGTGLGLSISKSIVEHMQGHIGFAPAEGGGTVFFFELPRAERAAT